MSVNILSLIKGQVATFDSYRKGNLYYRLSGEDGFLFPIPIDDLGDATVSKSENALLLMRYIRKHLTTIEQEKGSLA